MKNKLFKKFISFSIGSWVGLVIGLLTTIITTRIFSPETFGIISMFTLAINISVIFIIFGTDQSFVRFYYEENEYNRGGLLYNSLKIPILITLLISLFILIFNKEITSFLFEEESIVAAALLILGILAQVFFRFASLVIRMQQKGKMYSTLEILNKSLNLIFMLTLYLSIGKSYEVLMYSSVLTIVILAIVAIYYEKNFWNPKNFYKKNLLHSQKEIIKYGFPMVLTILITWLFQGFDRIAIKQWSTLEELGLYTAAFKIVALLNVLQTTFSIFWTPVSFEHYEKNPSDKLLYEKVSKLLSVTMFLIATFTIAAKDLVVLLLGKEYHAAASIMPFLVFMPILYTLSETTVIGINFKKKPKMHIIIAGVSCVVNIVGNWFLVPKYGAIGASMSTAFSYIIFFILRTHISLRYYKVDYDLKKVYLMITILSLYAFYSISATFYLNLLMGIIVFLILLSIYSKDIFKLYNQYKLKNYN
jgi:O-antigen/teichoic acid export membrane protein